MDADGSNEIRLTNNPGDDNQPDWSPDGTKIAFSSRRDGNCGNLRDERRRLQPGQFDEYGRDDRNPAWSPDGSKIAFDSDREQPFHAQIYVMNADGSNQDSFDYHDLQRRSNVVARWLPDRLLDPAVGGPL